MYQGERYAPRSPYPLSVERLHELRIVINKTLRHVPGELAVKLAKRLDGSILAERLPHPWVASTVNKGKRINICLRDADGRWETKKAAIAVLLHELAHIATDSVGHTAEFHEHHNILKHAAVAAGYEFEYPQTYCGVTDF